MVKCNKIRYNNINIMDKTFNPFKLWGAYLGALIGLYATYKEQNPFSFLRSLFDFLEESDVELNIIGGFFFGFAIHLFLRALINAGKGRSTRLKNKGTKY